MKLTITMKEEFVRAVMQDVPQHDFYADFQKVVQDFAVSKMPPEIRKIWRNNELRGFLRTNSYWDDLSCDYPIFGSSKSEECALIRELKEVKEIQLKARQESERRAQLRNKIKSAIYSVSTVKQARELLPEFEKYLPKPGESISKLTPAVIANLAADLTAAGWPKGRKR